jgi:Ran GTPase-activating protein (RanGAP) involved in mRNA processing and transport
MQNNNPELLSTTRFNKSSYVIRELQPSSDKMSFKKIKEQHEDIKQVIDDMAMLTASAQIRISGRKGAAVADELIAFGNKKGWQKKLIDFSKSYSKKVNDYYQEYLQKYNDKKHS